MDRRPHSNYDPRHFLSVGYDTVALHLVSACLAGLAYHDVKATVEALPWVGSAGNRKRRAAGFVRKLGGLVVWLSLPRVAHGDNAAPLGPGLVVPALRQVAEAFGVPPEVVLQARVYRLDLVANLALRLRPSEYVRRLVHVGRAALHPYSPTSRAFTNKTRELAFYDKGAELLEKGLPVPSAFAGLNVLRYELRMLRGLTRVFGEPVYAADLAGPAVYRRAVNEWAARFNTVQVQSVRDFGVPANVHELMGRLAAGYVADHGAEAVVAAIEAHCADGLITTTQRARQRGRVLDLAAGAASADFKADDLVAELQEAVHAAANRSLCPTA